MRCILVNDANLKAEAYCIYCRKKIGDSYAREIGGRFLYCDFDCYRRGTETTTLPSGYVAPPVNTWIVSS